MRYLVATNDDQAPWSRNFVGIVGVLQGPEEFEQFIRQRRGRNDEVLIPIVGKDPIQDALEFDELDCIFEGSNEKLILVTPEEEFVSEVYMLVGC